MNAFTRKRIATSYNMVFEASRNAGIQANPDQDECVQCEPFTPERIAQAAVRLARAKAKELDWGRNKTN